MSGRPRLNLVIPREERARAQRLRASFPEHPGRVLPPRLDIRQSAALVPGQRAKSTERAGRPDATGTQAAGHWGQEG